MLAIETIGNESPRYIIKDIINFTASEYICIASAIKIENTPKSESGIYITESNIFNASPILSSLLYSTLLGNKIHTSSAINEKEILTNKNIARSFVFIALVF
ncbi:MAG: hypothetical protein J6Q72_01045 [Clostridia bacterium]|nr:hypothetical protein [Clostridia bacterium]